MSVEETARRNLEVSIEEMIRKNLDDHWSLERKRLSYADNKVARGDVVVLYGFSDAPEFIVLDSEVVSICRASTGGNDSIMELKRMIPLLSSL